ncbi:MAG TPA: hypothetical protein VGM06_19090 [Polyangiaceae bacterium]
MGRRAGAGLFASLWALACLGAGRNARACGVTVGGAAGISGCSLSEHEEAERPKWRVGASYSFTSTAIRFSGDQRFDEERHAALATLDYRPTRTVTLEAGAGLLAGGHISTPIARYDFTPGFVSAVGASWRVVDADGAIPFVLLTGQISYATTTTQGVGYNAFDARAGAIVGTTVWRVLAPYLVGRAFGGPVYWRYQGAAVTGTDVFHYQVGVGLSLTIARRIDLFAEGVPLGELGVSAGLGVSF